MRLWRMQLLQDGKQNVRSKFFQRSGFQGSKVVGHLCCNLQASAVVLDSLAYGPSSEPWSKRFIHSLVAR